MRIYYDLILWEEVEENDTEKLKTKFQEMGKRFSGYGVLEFKMRAAQQQIQADEQIQEQPQVQQPQQQPQVQQQYVDEQGNPVTPTEDDTIVDE